MDFETITKRIDDLTKLFLNHEHKGFDKSKVISSIPAFPDDVHQFLNGNGAWSTPLYRGRNSLVLFDASVGGSGAPAVGGTYTRSFTVASNSYRFLVVSVLSADHQTVSGATYNGVAMTLQYTQPNIVNHNVVYTFTLLAPATGSHSLAIATSSTSNIDYTIHSYYNVDQTTPLNVAASGGSGSGYTPANPATISLQYNFISQDLSGAGSPGIPNDVENHDPIWAGDFGMVTTAGGMGVGGGGHAVYNTLFISPTGFSLPTGITIAKTAIGKYTITHNIGDVDYSFIATAANMISIPYINLISTTTVEVWFYSTASALQDTGFDFIIGI